MNDSTNHNSDYRLYHYWGDPHSRRVRLHLGECGVQFADTIQLPWQRDEKFLKINPAGQLPVLMTPHDSHIVGSYAISEYLEVRFPGGLFGETPKQAAEIRRLMDWFDLKFYGESLQYILEEKINKTLRQEGTPNSAALKVGYANLEIHLNYCEWLLGRRDRLAGDELSLADLTAAAHLSLADYLGCIAWDNFPLTGQWYVRLKSRPCFRGILGDVIPSMPPAKHYSDLDFLEEG